jgi:hypothetical protein
VCLEHTAKELIPVVIMSFAFINIHLDIYRIIIMLHKEDRCFRK